MIKIVCLPIEFEGKEYYTLLRARMKPERTELKITIMNGELEQALYGNNIFKYENGYLVADIPNEGSKGNSLKLAVVNALQEYLSSNPLNEYLFEDHSPL